MNAAEQGQDACTVARPCGTRVVLTGATGFLGRHVVRALLGQGVAVTVVVRECSDVTHLNELGGELSVIRWAVEDARSLEGAFSGGHVDAVLHLATAYGRNGESEAEIVCANEILPMRLLEAATAANATLFLNADTFYSSRTVFEHGLAQHVHSKERLRARVADFAVERAIRVANVRIEHMYGPRDHPRKFITQLLGDLIAHKPLIPLTAGEQRRDFVYVDDVARAFTTLVAHRAQLPASFADFQVGVGSAVRLREMVELAHELCGSRSELRFGAIPYRERELMVSAADTRELQRLGWTAQIPLRDGLARAIAAMRSANVDRPA
jgi:nucleoside-diphosphate-sugar epimerase